MRRYLLVDDNRQFVENLGEILSDTGSEVAVATSGAEALQLLSQGHFDVLLTDMKMPEMSGAELVYRARQIDPDLPAVIITAFCGQDDVDRSIHEGVLAVLAKPVPITELLDLLAKARRVGPIGLVEDDPVLAEHLAETLSQRGFASMRARSAAEAASLVDLRPFAMLLDLSLPDSPRGEVLTMIEARLPEVPVIVMTGFKGLADALRRRHAVFEKPFDVEVLMAEIEKLHSSFNAEQQAHAPAEGGGEEADRRE